MAALSEIEKLEARWAENPDGRYFAPLADAYRKAGRLDEALTIVTGGLGKHPDYLSAHIVYGRILLERKDEPAAMAAFEKVLALDSENIIALKSLAEIAERTGDTMAARRWLQRLVNVDAMNQEAVDDLNRLGGPLPEDGQEAPAEEAPQGISFMDLESPAPQAEAAPAPEAAEPVVPKTLERMAVKWPPPAPEPTPTLEIEPTAAPAHAQGDAQPASPPLELEHASFQAPADMPSAPSGDVVPFDDQLAWGAGERQSRAVHPEDVAKAEQHHEPTTPAIEFMDAEQPPGRASHSGPPPAGAAAASGNVDPNMPTQPMGSVAPPAGWSGVQMSSESPTIEMPPVKVPEQAEAQPAAMAMEPPQDMEAAGGATTAAHDLPLIMPEDVTPADEMRRPSSKLVQMVSPEPELPGEGSGEPMVTETMGDLYLKQGFKDQAADVYRRLLSARPGDAGLKAKLSALESPPAMSAKALGQEAVGAWLKRIAMAQLGSKAAAPPPAPEPGPTPMEQAFSSGDQEPASAPAPVPVADASTPAGAPARQATDQYSLDQLFGGGQPQQGGQRRSTAKDPSGSHTLGASFDEFFGSAPKQAETVRPKEGGPGGRQSEDDLSAFNAWLHGLKR